ncbi:hypothetical protein [Pseudomonas sp. MWU12-2345]|uniref:hypothetical protein n=1 Tax=Pseudomonas sp. MWU12-2345 TaxID=2928689 RepID=UPI00200DD183|nr:hypothetical protein [Pseudomonas sp. MWU12-2345]
MLFSAYTEESLSGIGHVVQDIEQVNRHTDGLRNRLSGLFELTASRFGVSFSIPSGSYFQIEGHFGLVRANLVYANEGNGTFARVVLRKHTLDEQGKEAWPEIWAFRILKDGDILMSDAGPVLYNSWNTPDGQRDVATQPLIESIVLSAMKPR